jgi:hypothetical protein
LRKLTLRPPKGVRSLKGDKVNIVETHVSEFFLNDIQRVEWAWEILSALDVGLRAIAAPERHTPGWPSSQFDRDFSRKGKDVGTGNGAGASYLQHLFDVVDHIEPTR